jgi:DNA-damage-inducible protein D
MVRLGSGAEREVNDCALTRYACYLIAQNGDPRKPEIAAAQAYFIISTRAHEMHQLREEQEKRLVMRLKVSESYKQLADVAYQSGVNSETFGIFVDAGYLGLHHHTVEELKERKGVPEHEDYLDNITREELSAIDFKNVQTEAKLHRDPVSSLDEASHTHYFIGDQVRKAIAAMHAPMPEDLPPAASIRKMVEDRRKAANKRKVKASEPAQGQETLFPAQNQMQDN